MLSINSYTINTIGQFNRCILLMVLSTLVLTACRKPELDPVDDVLTIDEAGAPDALPTVRTIRVDGIFGIDTLIVVSEVVRHGTSWVTNRGICYGTVPSPTIESGDTIPFPISDLTTVGEFSLPWDSAALGMYVRAYATNASGTGYGEPLIITGIQVFTDSVGDVTQTSGTVHARVEGNGPAGVRGICYSSTNPTPTIDDIRVPDTGVGFGEFVVQLDNLVSGTVYTVRAYVFSGDGSVSYGDTLSFRTRLCPPTILDITGIEYNVVEINGRCWMKENLRTSKYNQDITSNNIYFRTDTVQWSMQEEGARSAPNNDSTNNVGIYGWLYNWYAVTDDRGLCPTGWKIPSQEDWVGLLTVLENAADLQDMTGFSALSAGVRDSSGLYSLFGESGYWWSSTSNSDSTLGWALEMSTGISIQERRVNDGLSVRCIKSP